MTSHTVASREEWLAARQKLLSKEKEFTRLRDELSAERRKLPWVKVDKKYVFEGPSGKLTLADLFAGRNQLIVYHFMLGPDWSEGCPSCSLLVEGVDEVTSHLAARDVTYTAVSRAPMPQIEAFKRRMGWRFPWVSSSGTDFNFDYHVSFKPEELASGQVEYNFTRMGFGAEEAPGASVFAKDERGDVFHTYSTYGRGGEVLMLAYQYLDLVPKGRDEDNLAFSMAWVRHHDRYGPTYKLDVNAPYAPPPKLAAPCPACSAETK